jgi:glycine/D-amino acid oxidase-like deaminating enzyme/nitrite reductase/ring-hydroxylating ferredoxin subunit
MIENIPSNTRPIWADTAVIPKQVQQTGQVSVDVCIIGAGITGLTAADLLKRAGKTVAVIDLARIGYGETSHTTAHLTEVFDIDYHDLISKFGLEGAQLAAQSMRRSIERIEENSKSGIPCDFTRVSGYQYTENRGDVDEIEREAEYAQRVGVPSELLFQAPLPYRTARAVRFDHQAQFNPLKYLDGLARRIPGNGSFIFEETRMVDIEEGEPCRVVTDRGTIIADDVFVAANVPSSNRFFLHTKIAAYRTYAIAARVNNAFDYKNLFWDIADPYHYIRSYEINDVPYIIIGGEDHKTGQDIHTGIHFQKLEDWAFERFAIETLTHRWSGQIIESVDGLPFIGRNPMSDHVFVATGFSGTGMTFGTVAGMLISDLILGNQNPWAELYDAGRVKPLAGIKSFLSENIDFPSHLIGDRLTRAQVSDSATIRENEGAIVRVGAKKVAAYRDPEGELHLMSPVCPHLGCYVNWNEAEKSWDCPCHGSRFSPVGKLLNGPAVSDLASEEIDDNLAPITERYEKAEERPSLDPFGAPVLSFFSCPLKPRPT